MSFSKTESAQFCQTLTAENLDEDLERALDAQIEKIESSDEIAPDILENLGDADQIKEFKSEDIPSGKIETIKK